jgi:tRNA pseudouridine38-40 synthase
VRNLKLTLQYDGTNFVGWQRQAEGTSIQGLVEDALTPIAGSRVVVHGAGRTDAGVHALGQVATASLDTTLEPTTLARALNAVLPTEVRVLSVEDVPTEFHARFSAVGKAYEYRIVNAPIVSPFIVRYAWHVPQPLDVASMKAAACGLVGQHDFAAFQAAGSAVSSTVRVIHRIDWLEGEGHSSPMVMRIAGDGFLRHMVRNIVGTLIEVGLSRWPADRVAEILASGDRARAGPTVPPHGLFLIRVEY